MFWPSFNSAAAASGDAQMRAVINTCRHYKTGKKKS